MRSKLNSTDGRKSALHLLHRASQRADELFIASTGKSDLRPRQYAVLRVLAKNQDISQTDIVEATGIDRSTLADIVRRLVSKGLVKRNRTKEDARMYEVRLTASGQNALATAEQAAKTAETRLLAKLSASDRNAMLDSLARLVEQAPMAAPATKKKVKAKAPAKAKAAPKTAAKKAPKKATKKAAKKSKK